MWTTGTVLSNGWIRSLLFRGEEDGDLDGALPPGDRITDQGKQGGMCDRVVPRASRHFAEARGARC